MPQKFLLKTFVLLLLVFSETTYAQLLNTKLPVDPAIKVGKLANGLTYIIRQNKKPADKVELRLVVNAGSILEDSDQQGLAHFNEHMAFNGSKHFPKNELVSFLQSIGVQFGADLNAYTGFDETVYILPIPLGDTGNFRKGLTVLQDWAGGLSFDSLQIDGERPVILEESRLGKGADDRMFRKIYPVQYEGSRYALRLPIGKDSIIKNFKHASLTRFYHTWYRPDNMAVIIVGDIDPVKAEQMVREYFGGLKNPVPEKKRFYASVPPRKKSEAIVVTDKEATNFVSEVDFPFTPSKVEVTLGDYRRDLVKSLFTSLLNQRFADLTHSSNPPFLYAGAGYESLARGYEGFSAYTVAGQAGPDTALNALMKEIERAKLYGFTQDELDRAKKNLMAAMEQDYNNRDKHESGDYVQEYIRFYLDHEPSPGIVNEYQYYKELLPGIKLSEVDSLTTPLKQDAHIFVSLQGPSDSKYTLPDNKQLLTEAESALHEKVAPLKEAAVAASLMKKIPEPGKILRETYHENLGVTEIDFENGVKAILKPTTFKDDEILMTSFRKGGYAKYPASYRDDETFASAIVHQMGVADFSPTDLTKILAGKTASASATISKLSSGITGSSSKADLSTMLQLTYLEMTQPRKDEALFNAWKEKSKSSVQFALQNPQTAFIDTFITVRYHNSPFAPIAVPKPEDYDNINLDSVLSIYKDQFSDANGFTFIFVGSFQVDSIKPLLARYLGSLPSKGNPAGIIDNGLRPAAGDISFTYRKGTEPKSLILKVYSGEVPYSEDLALKASALAQVLNIKIIEDLREKMGAIYGGGIYGGLNKFPYNNYGFVLQLPCGPNNVDTLIKAADAEIDSVKNDGPSAETLEKVKKTWIEQYKVQVTENGYWSGKLEDIYFQGDSPENVLNYETRVNNLTADDIKTTAQLLFDGKNVLQAVLVPEGN